MKTRLVIRKVGVLSFAKIQGALYALLGLLIGAFVSLFAMLGSAMSSAMGRTDLPSSFGVFFGAGSIIVFPIFYGAIGFIAGLIMAGLYNLLAGSMGGIEIEGVQTQTPE
jgi:hypothetical protein